MASNVLRSCRHAHERSVARMAHAPLRFTTPEEVSMFRFGKHPPKVDYRTLRFRTYATPALAAPPPSANVVDRVLKNLHTTNVSDLFPMDGNDVLGDCTIA